MGDTEIQRELAGIRSEISRLDGDVRVAKHDVANMRQAQQGINIRLDKMEERLGNKIEGLSDKLGNLNTQQARGLGFFAGIAFMITSAGALLLALGKLLFSQA